MRHLYFTKKIVVIYSTLGLEICKWLYIHSFMGLDWGKTFQQLSSSCICGGTWEADAWGRLAKLVESATAIPCWILHFAYITWLSAVCHWNSAFGNFCALPGTACMSCCCWGAECILPWLRGDKFFCACCCCICSCSICIICACCICQWCCCCAKYKSEFAPNGQTAVCLKSPYVQESTCEEWASEYKAEHNSAKDLIVHGSLHLLLL